MITKFEEYTLNESFDMKNIKTIFLNKIKTLPEDKLDLLKNDLLPYKNLTKEQISKKLKLKLKDIDPYGEENWDPEVDRRNFLKSKIKKLIVRLFGETFVCSLLLTCAALFAIMINMLYYLGAEGNISGAFSNANINYISMGIVVGDILSGLIFFLCLKFWRNEI